MFVPALIELLRLLPATSPNGVNFMPSDETAEIWDMIVNSVIGPLDAGGMSDEAAGGTSG